VHLVNAATGATLLLIYYYFEVQAVDAASGATLLLIYYYYYFEVQAVHAARGVYNVLGVPKLFVFTTITSLS
jgi:hypothetical protein